MTDGSRKAIFAAFFANLGIAISKFVGFLITGSASLLAETIHSLADTGNQLLLFLGGKRAGRSESAAHPFGYGRERYFWAFAVALVLFSAGGMFALYEGISKLRDPHEIESMGVAVTILLVAIVLESFSLRTAVRAGVSASSTMGRACIKVGDHVTPCFSNATEYTPPRRAGSGRLASQARTHLPNRTQANGAPRRSTSWSLR